MDIEVVTLKGTNKLVKWNVGIPRLGMSIESKSFEMYTFHWNLKLFTKPYSNGTDEQWSMKLYYSKENTRNPLWFPLSIYIQDKGTKFLLNREIISAKISKIWSSTHSDFKKRYPGVQVEGIRVQFVLDFHLGLHNLENPIKVEKFVQTSDSNTGEKYAENQPCLENLSLDLSKLVEHGTHTDVRLKCGDFSIGAHKLILGARSEVFRNMVQSDMAEGREYVVEIIDMEHEILNIFIRYIYTGNLPELTMDTALPIYKTAYMYQVEGLKKRSSQFLVKNLSPENALGILATADALFDSELKDQLLPYIIKEKMPSRKVEWLEFCNECPNLANEVLNFYYNLTSVSQ